MTSTPSREELVDRVHELRPQQRSVAAAVLDAMTDLEAPATAALVEAMRGMRASAATVKGERLPGLPEVPMADLQAAVVRNEARVWKVRRALYETGLSREEAAERVGVQPNQVTNLLRERKLLAIEGAEGLRLPVWQFDPNARRGRLEGIDRVVQVFPGRVLGLSSWMGAPNAALGGRTPREALLDGDVERVVAAAEHLAS